MTTVFCPPISASQVFRLVPTQSDSVQHPQEFVRGIPTPNEALRAHSCSGREAVDQFMQQLQVTDRELAVLWGQHLQKVKHCASLNQACSICSCHPSSSYCLQLWVLGPASHVQKFKDKETSLFYWQTLFISHPEAAKQVQIETHPGM